MKLWNKICFFLTNTHCSLLQELSVIDDIKFNTPPKHTEIIHPTVKFIGFWFYTVHANTWLVPSALPFLAINMLWQQDLFGLYIRLFWALIKQNLYVNTNCPLSLLSYRRKYKRLCNKIFSMEHQLVYYEIYLTKTDNEPEPSCKQNHPAVYTK